MNLKAMTALVGISVANVGCKKESLPSMPTQRASITTVVKVSAKDAADAIYHAGETSAQDTRQANPAFAKFKRTIAAVDHLSNLQLNQVINIYTEKLKNTFPDDVKLELDKKLSVVTDRKEVERATLVILDSMLLDLVEQGNLSPDTKTKINERSGKKGYYEFTLANLLPAGYFIYFNQGFGKLGVYTTAVVYKVKESSDYNEKIEKLAESIGLPKDIKIKTFLTTDISHSTDLKFSNSGSTTKINGNFIIVLNSREMSLMPEGSPGRDLNGVILNELGNIKFEMILSDKKLKADLEEYCMSKGFRIEHLAELYSDYIQVKYLPTSSAFKTILSKASVPLEGLSSPYAMSADFFKGYALKNSNKPTTINIYVEGAIKSLDRFFESLKIPTEILAD